MNVASRLPASKHEIRENILVARTALSFLRLETEFMLRNRHVSHRLRSEQARLPFMRDMKPSLFKICTVQSIDPLYFTASPDVIIMRLRTVSTGYDRSPDVIVTM